MTAPPMPPTARTPARTGPPLPRFADGGVTDTERSKFVNSMWPHALRWSQQTGIPPEIFAAIGASETNWGRAGGFFGIKGSSPKGKSANYATFEYDKNGNRYDINDQFAVYDNADEGFDHFMSLVSSPGSRYEGAWKRFQQNGDVAGFLNGLVSAGYATDKNWPNNILALGRQAKAMADPNVQPAAAPATAPAGAAQPQVAGAAPAQGGTSADAFSQGLFEQAQENYNGLIEERKRLLALPTRTEAQNQRLLMLNQVDIPGALAELTKTYTLIKPSAGESPSAMMNAETGRLSAQTSAFNSMQNANTNTLSALANVMDMGMKGRESEARFLFDFMKTAFDQAASKYKMQLDKGQLDLNGYTALVQAQAMQQTAEAARMMNALATAEVINKNDWAMAREILPPNMRYQPGFAPGDPMNVMLKQLGLGQNVIETAPVDAAKLDIRNTLTEADKIFTNQGYARPNFAVADIAQQVKDNKAIGDFTGQSLTTQSFTDAGGQFPKAPDYSSITQFLNLTMANIQGQNQWWNQPSTSTVANPYAAPVDTVKTAAPAPVTANPTLYGGDIESVEANARAMNAASVPAGANSFTSPNSNVRAAPGWNRDENGNALPVVNTTTANSFTSGNPNAPVAGFTVDPKTGQVVRAAPSQSNDQYRYGADVWEPDPNDGRWEMNRGTGQRRRKAGT